MLRMMTSNTLFNVLKTLSSELSLNDNLDVDGRGVVTYEVLMD